MGRKLGQLFSVVLPVDQDIYLVYLR
uniref:Uncharacterized protein n=1 Tax=Rhizophora mucronata TaxID=61149 RepID=A0A2P2QW09_RHIMU